MNKISGIRFAGIINKQGRKISGGFNPDVTPLEKDVKKLEMLFMETALDYSMRKEFDKSLGEIKAIVSYRSKTNIITIIHGENFLLLSAEPELNTAKVIQMAVHNLPDVKTLEIAIH